MFYSKDILVRRHGGLGVIWLAATLGSRSGLKKLSKREVAAVDVSAACDFVARPSEPLALRLSSNLMMGIARIHQHQYSFYFADVTHLTAQLKRALAAPGDCDAAVNLTAPLARHDAITLGTDEVFVAAATFSTLDCTFSALPDQKQHLYEWGWMRDPELQDNHSLYSGKSASVSSVSATQFFALEPSPQAFLLDASSVSHKTTSRRPSGIEDLDLLDVLGTRRRQSNAPQDDVDYLNLGLDAGETDLGYFAEADDLDWAGQGRRRPVRLYGVEEVSNEDLASALDQLSLHQEPAELPDVSSTAMPQGKQTAGRNKRKLMAMFDSVTELSHEEMRELPKQARLSLDRAHARKSREAVHTLSDTLLKQAMGTPGIPHLAPDLRAVLQVSQRPPAAVDEEGATSVSLAPAAEPEDPRFDAYDDNFAVDASIEAPRAELPWSVKYPPSDLGGRRSETGSSPGMGAAVTGRVTPSDGALSRMLDSPSHGAIAHISLSTPGSEMPLTLDAPMYFAGVHSRRAWMDPNPPWLTNGRPIDNDEQNLSAQAGSALEKESVNFFNYTTSIMEGAGARQVYFSELMEPAGKKRDAAAQAFYHVLESHPSARLVLATKSLIKVQQPTAFGDISISAAAPM
ncbi:R8 protein [Sorochytrium milnesiophthora]